MGNHSQFYNQFKECVHKTSQRYVLTVPKPIGEAVEIISGRFSFIQKTKKFVFGVEDIDKPLILNNKEKAANKYDDLPKCTYCGIKCVDKENYRKHLLDIHNIDINTLLANMK